MMFPYNNRIVDYVASFPGVVYTPADARNESEPVELTETGTVPSSADYEGRRRLTLNQVPAQQLGMTVTVAWEVDGDEGQGHVAGGLWLRPYAFPEADPVEVYAPTAFGALQAGNLTEMAGWTVGKVGLWPHRYSAGARLDEFTATPGSLRNVNSPAPSEAYVVAVDPSLARTGGQGSRLRAIYGGGG
jgi:hypothetical protein